MANTKPTLLDGLLKEALYRIWCGVNRLGDSGLNRLGDTSAFVNPAGQLLLTRQGQTRMDGIGIVTIPRDRNKWRSVSNPGRTPDDSMSE